MRGQGQRMRGRGPGIERMRPANEMKRSENERTTLEDLEIQRNERIIVPEFQKAVRKGKKKNLGVLRFRRAGDQRTQIKTRDWDEYRTQGPEE